MGKSSDLPNPKKRQQRKRALKDATIRFLAKDVEEAHLRWPRLTTADRIRVLVAIATRYGWNFATEFQSITKRGAYSRPVHISGASHLNRDQVKRRGYRFVSQIAPEYERWVRPNGKEFHLFVRNSNQNRQPTTKPAFKAPGGAVKGIPKQLPEIADIDDAIDAYGDMIADKEMTLFGREGFVSFFDDGTIAFEDKMNGEENFTMRVAEGGNNYGRRILYEFYNSDGQKQDITFPFDPGLILAD